MQPLLYAALAFAAGIALAARGPAWVLSAVNPPFGPWLIALAAAAAVGLLCARARRCAIACALAGCCLAGAARAHFVLAHPAPPSPVARLLPQLQPRVRDRVWLTGYLRDDPDHLPGAMRYDLELASIAADTPNAIVWPVTGGVRLYSYDSGSAPTYGEDDPIAEAPNPAAPAAAPTGNWQLATGNSFAAGEGIAVRVHLRAVRSFHDPGVADLAASLRREGIEYSATLAPGAWKPAPTIAGPRLPALRAHLWSWLSRRLDLLVPPRAAFQCNALLRGMLLGDVARLDGPTRDDFQIDGVYHLLVVAGLHIGVLAGFLMLLLRWLGVPRLPAGAVTLALLGAYAWMIAGRTPTLRALLMLAVYFGARIWYRERQALNAVGCAGFILLLAHPLDLFASGFQMSLTAAALLAGVVLPILRRTSHPARQLLARPADDADDAPYLLPRLALWRLRLQSLPPARRRLVAPTLRVFLGLYDLLLISAVLQVGFAGFNAVNFHRASPWAMLANALLVPAAALLIPAAWAGLAAMALLAPFPGAARVFRHTFGAALAHAGALLLRAAAALARWPLANLRVPSPPDWYLLLYACAIAAAIAAWAFTPAGRRAPLVAASAAALLLALLLVAFPFAPRLPPGLTATVLDIGQGDSIFVSFPDGRTLLVDGGPSSAHWDSGEQIVAPFLWSLGLRRIDAILLTHGHNDHLGGLPAILADFHPSEVWVSATLPTERPVTEFLRRVAASGARLRLCKTGDRFAAGSAVLEVLLPPPLYHSGPIAGNDDSLAVRIRYGPQSMLLTGDTELPGEDWMLAHHLDLQSQLLKVGHHGSRTSSSPAFLAAVRPQAAIISVGADNLYGHPAPDVVARLQQMGVRVFRTDQDGAIQCRLTGSALEVFLFPRALGD